MTRALGDSMVKACLFLLVAVAVAHDAPCAASSPGCSSKMQADATTLLQTGVRIGDELAPGHTDQEVQKHTYTDEATNPHKVSWMQEGMNTQQLKEKLIDNSKGKGRRDVLIQLSRFVNTLGNATKHFNSSNADNLKEVIKILRAVMYKSMNTDHTEDQNELHQAFAGITTCNTDLATAITDNVTPKKSTMVTARSTHKTCRSEEAGLETIKTEKWDDVNTHMKHISEPEPVTAWPAVPTYDFLVTYFSTGYGQWLVTQKQAFDTKKNAYVSANTNWTTSKDRCDRDQTTFESNFCVYNSVLDTTCLGHDTCHTSASSGAITTTARVKITEAARKDAYKAGEEIVCRINALLANRAYSECDNLTVNTSNYSIVYPTADNKDSCVTEAEQPCSATWENTEYNGLPSNAPNKACTPCVAPTTLTTSTTAAPQESALGHNQYQSMEVFYEASKTNDNRGDQTRAMDGNTGTWSYLTPPGHQHANTWHLVSFKLKGTEPQVINYVRVAKYRPDRGHHHFNSFKYSDGSGDVLRNLNYTSVTNLKNGCGGTEQNVAFQYDSNTGETTEKPPFHDFGVNGWYCYTFDPVSVRAFAIGFKQGCCTHMKLAEMELGYHNAYASAR